MLFRFAARFRESGMEVEVLVRLRFPASRQGGRPFRQDWRLRPLVVVGGNLFIIVKLTNNKFVKLICLVRFVGSVVSYLLGCR